MSRSGGWVVAAILVCTGTQAATVATVGDSLADAIYLGLKLQPDLLRQDGLQVMRWSRPKIGLTRLDYFDYTAFIRDTGSLGNADFCVVEMGANDLQSIDLSAIPNAALSKKLAGTTEPGAGGKAEFPQQLGSRAGPVPASQKKWVKVGTADWQKAYAERVRGLVETLKSGRCGKVVWLLQPAYQKNKFLGQYHEMMNAAQLAGVPAGAAAFEIAAGDNDYSDDGVHPNKDFSFRLGRAVANLLASWQQPFAGSNCVACHSGAAKLIPSRLRDIAPLVLKHAD